MIMRKLTKKQQSIKRAFIFVFMVIAVLTIVSGIILFISGYRLDNMNGRLEQGALVQFDSRPNNAQVTIDEVSTGSSTSTKRSLKAGIHSFLVEKDQYRSWQKTLDLEAGTLTWLDYIRLVPNDLTPQTVGEYETVAGVKAAPDLQFIVVQKDAATPSFDLVDIRNKEVRSTVISLPADLYSESATEGVVHSFSMESWDDSGRHMLVRHTYNDSTEWIVMDTEQVGSSVNASRIAGLSFTDLQFAGTSGKILYGLADGDIRRIDLSSATLSRVLITKAASFNMYGNNRLTYVGEDVTNAQQRVVGFYSEGDDQPYVLETFKDPAARLAIDTVRYHSSDYIVYAENDKVTLWGGRYPNADQERSATLRVVTEMKLPGLVDTLSFSSTGAYLVAQSGQTQQSYELEHDRTSVTTIESGDVQAPPLRWLDRAYLWNIYGGQVSIREFDGANPNTIMPAEAGFDVTLSQNGRYIYAVNKTDDGYRLQRVTMILE